MLDAMAKRIQPDDYKFPLRLPRDLADAIQTLANQEERSMNGQIIVLLRAALANHSSATPDHR